jgi:glycosyltransferase involved in cell wall biosynthesis
MLGRVALAGVTMTGPLTVVIPLYNGERFIAATLDSLADQTVPLREVIVVDDGSTDAGPRITRDHSIKARVIHQANAGIAVARNRGAFEAKSRFVTFLDQDDLWMPRRHERLLAYLTANPQCRALSTSETLFYLTEDRLRLIEMDELLHVSAIRVANEAELARLRSQRDYLNGPPEVARVVATRDLLLGTIGVTCSNVVERELFFSVGGCCAMTRTMDDWLGMLNVSRLTEFPLLDEPSIMYRIHPTSTTMATKWSLPFLTSIIAARHGGMLVPPGRARSPEYVSVGLFWRHWLLQLARSDVNGLIDAIALTRLLASTDEHWGLEALRLTKTSIATRVRRARATRMSLKSSPCERPAGV